MLILPLLLIHVNTPSITIRNYDRALQLMQRATAVPAKRAAYHDRVCHLLNVVLSYNDNLFVL